MQNTRSFDWLNYCFPAGVLAGVRIGIHWSFPLFLLTFSLEAGSKGGTEWGWVVASSILLLFVAVLAHEFGHVFAARREGASCDQVMLWPLGGLTFVGEELLGPPEARVAAAGPAVNFAVFVLLIPVLALASIQMRPEILNPFGGWWPVPTTGTPAGFARDVLYTTFKLNLVALLLNLLPAFPLDGGRILRGLLHPRMGAFRSILATTTLSLVLSSAMLVLAIVFKSMILGLVAVLVGFSAWAARRSVLAILADEGGADAGFMGYDFSMGHTSLEGRAAGRRSREERLEEKARRRAEKEAEEEREIEEELDRLLEKIHREGMESLSKKERAFLDRASRRKR